MPFDPRGLTALTQANGFSLWHYRTTDPRTAVLGTGYFATVADRLRAGDLLIVQAADATALLPVRADGAAAPGVTLDSAGTGLALTRSATQLLTVTQAATAVPRAIALAPPPGVVEAGETVTAVAAVTGLIASVAFGLLDAAGTPVQPAQTVAVVAASAAASFTAPATAGSGYRIRAADAADPTLATLSPPFGVAAPARLLLETGGLLLAEHGGALRL